MLWFLLPHSPWNVFSNDELWRSYNTLRSELVLPPASTLSNICRREYLLTVDANKQWWPSRNNVSLALDGSTSIIKLAITLVIAYYMDRNWALRDVQLRLDDVDNLFFSYSECYFRLLSQGSTYWTKASHTFEGSSGSFWANRWPFTRNYDR